LLKGWQNCFSEIDVVCSSYFESMEENPFQVNSAPTAASNPSSLCAGMLFSFDTLL
jgi:hypothetical protein